MTLRAVNSLPPTLGPFGSEISDVVLSASRRGVWLSVAIQDGSRPQPEPGEAITCFLRAWVASLPTGSEGRITLLGIGDETVLMLVGPSSGRLPAAPGWTRTDEAGQVLFEASWDTVPDLDPLVVTPTSSRSHPL